MSTGSFILSGSAPSDTSLVTVSVEGQTGEAELQAPQNGQRTWHIELTPTDSGTFDFEVVATDSAGDSSRGTLTLQVIAHSEDDVLFTPGYVAAADIDVTAIAYTPDENMVVLPGDLTSQLEPGMVITGDPSDAAPDGYLRVVESVRLVDGNTVVVGPMGALDSLFRQVDNRDVVVSENGGGALAREGSFFGPLEVTVSLDEEPNARVEFKLLADVNSDFDIDIDWCEGWFCLAGPDLRYFMFEAVLEIGIQGEIVGTFGRNPEKPSWGPFTRPLYDVIVATIPIGPVLTTVRLEGSLRAEADIYTQIETTGSFTLVAGGGYEYRDDGTGRGFYRVGPSAEPLLEVAGNIRLDAFVGFDQALKFRVFDVFGPQGITTIGYGLETEAGIRTEVGGLEAYAELVGKLEAEAALGLDTELLGFNWGEEVFGGEPRIDIDKASWTLGSYEISRPLFECGDNGDIAWLGIDLTRLPPCATGNDQTPPNLFFDLPSNALTGSTVTVEGQATDNSSGIRAVYLTVCDEGGRCWNGSDFVNGEARVAAALTPEEGATSTEWSAEFIPARYGVYSVLIDGFDRAGNSYSDQFDLFVRDDPSQPEFVGPELNWDEPGIFDEVAVGVPLVIEGTVRDNVGVASVFVQIEDGDGRGWNGSRFVEGSNDIEAELDASGAETGWSYSSFVPPAAEPYDIRVQAVDLSGNESASSVRRVIGFQDIARILSPSPGSEIGLETESFWFIDPDATSERSYRIDVGLTPRADDVSSTDARPNTTVLVPVEFSQDLDPYPLEIFVTVLVNDGGGWVPLIEEIYGAAT